MENEKQILEAQIAALKELLAIKDETIKELRHRAPIFINNYPQVITAPYYGPVPQLPNTLTVTCETQTVTGFNIGDRSCGGGGTVTSLHGAGQANGFAV